MFTIWTCVQRKGKSIFVSTAQNSILKIQAPIFISGIIIIFIKSAYALHLQIHFQKHLFYGSYVIFSFFANIVIYFSDIRTRCVILFFHLALNQRHSKLRRLEWISTSSAKTILFTLLFRGSSLHIGQNREISSYKNVFLLLNMVCGIHHPL